MKANVLCFDVEAYRATRPASLAWLERKKPKNKTLENHIADSAKNPMVAELLCIGIKTDDFEFSFDCMSNSMPQELNRFVNVVDEFLDDQTVITGYNIKHYDLHVMMMHFQRYQIEPPRHWPIWTGKFWRGRIHDTMERFPGSTPPNMGEACAMYGIDGKMFEHNGRIITGADVGDLFDAGEYQAIIEYCASDVEAEYSLYQHQTFSGNWGAYDDDRSELKQILTELDRNETMSNSAKWLTARPILSAARLL